jgi:ABC-type tungstate transport system substrate-binding protein
MDQYFRNPVSAAIISAAITMAYVFARNKMNGRANVPNSEYAKPAFLVALLVYLIVSQGCGQRESVSLEPF